MYKLSVVLDDTITALHAYLYDNIYLYHLVIFLRPSVACTYDVCAEERNEYICF